MKIIDINGRNRECLEVKTEPNYPGFVKVTYASRRDPSTSRDEWYPIHDFLVLNPDLKKTISAPKDPIDILGVVTKAAKDNLVDNTQNWTKNAYVNFTIWISRGKGEGQTRTIIANTHNKVTIKSNWDIIPDKSSQFVISNNIHDPQPLGNQLPGTNP